jgi:hypothetical protein
LGREAEMGADRSGWLDEYAVNCRVFKGRWNIRHCIKMYNDIKDLKIHMSSRFKGKVARYESTYNPCEHCRVLAGYLAAQEEENEKYEKARNDSNGSSQGVWAV